MRHRSFGPWCVGAGFPHEHASTPLRVRSQLVGGDVRGRPELQVLAGVAAQGDIDGTRDVEIGMIHERRHERIDGRAGRDGRPVGDCSDPAQAGGWYSQPPRPKINPPPPGGE